MIPETYVAKYYWLKEQGDLLKKTMKSKKITYEQLAPLLDYPRRQCISDIANARTGVIEPSKLEKLCKALGVDKSFFYPTMTIDKKLFD